MDTSSFAGKIDEINKAIAINALKNAAVLLDTGRADEALSVLDATMEINDSALLTVAKGAITEYAGIYLAEIEPDFKGEYITVGHASYNSSDYNSDAAGNTYNRDFLLYPDGGSLNSEYASAGSNGVITYYLGSRHDRLTGMLYLPYISRAVESPRCSSVVRIYGDDTLLYEAQTFIRGTYDPVAIDVDITGINTLKIAMYGIWAEGTGWAGWSDYHPMVCAADMKVSRTKKTEYDPLKILLDHAGKEENDFSTAILEQVRGAEAAGYRIGAIDTLQTACELSGDMGLQDALSEQKNRCATEAQTQAADIVAAERDYSEALRIINLAISRVGEKEDLISARKEYQSYLPETLVSMDYDVKGAYLSIGTGYSLDSDEVRHGGTYIFYADGGISLSDFAQSDDEGCIEYYLSGKYSKFTGTVYLPYISSSSNVESCSPVAFKVYGDDSLLYTCPPLSREGKGSVELEVDTAGVQVLRIVILGVQRTDNSYGICSYAPMLCACDLAVSR